MTKTNFRRTLVGAAVATAFAIGPADAGQWRGTFDPVTFAGEYILEVDQACIDQGSGWYANTGICAATLTSATAFVDSTSPDPSFYGTMTFAPPAISDPSQLFGIYVYGGAVDSFDTGLIHQVDPASPGGQPDWYIQFASGQCPPGEDCYGGDINIDLQMMFAPTAATSKGVYLYYGEGGSILADTADYIGRAVLIPEPGTLSLILGALGGGWLARRRRKEKVTDSN